MRYRPQLKFGKYWVYNTFRVLEFLFGRKYGVRPESSNDTETGITQFFTLESALMYMEGHVRALKLPKIEKVYIPQLAFATNGFIPQSTQKIPYLFAISAPTKDDANLTSYSQANPPSVSLTPSGSDRLMVWYFSTLSSGGGQYGDITAATFNTSESATDAGTHLVLNNAGGIGEFCIWYRVAPTATTANATCTINNSQGGTNQYIVIYSGVDQTTPKNAYGTTSGTGNSVALSITTTVDNSWVTGHTTNNGVSMTVGSGCSARRTSGGGDQVIDSGGAVTPAGAFSLNWSMGGSQPYGAIGIAISPVAATTSGKNFLMFM